MHLREELAGFFPAEVEFEVQAIRMPAEDETTPAERLCVAHTVPKRRREFLSGRAAARAALARLGIQGYDLLPQASRSPVWPEGIVGSISHGDELCIAAVAPHGRLTGLGVDCEPLQALEEPLWDRICTPGELQWILRQPLAERGIWARHFFSAKEAAYKFQHPITQTFLSFHDISVSFDPGAGKAFQIRGETQLSAGGNATPGLRQAGLLLQAAHCSWRRAAGQVISLVYGLSAADDRDS
jgi:4'-phosphopantetheinyl transferase EntD